MRRRILIIAAVLLPLVLLAQEVYLQHRRAAFRTVAAPAGGSTLSDGLIAHWDFEAGDGTTVTNAVAGGVVLTNVGTGYWTNSAAVGNYAYWYNVADSRSYVNDPNLIEGLSSLTISLWCKTMVSTRAAGETLLQQSGSGSGDAVSMSLNASEDFIAQVYVDPNVSKVAVYSMTIQDTNHWYHIVLLANDATDTLSIYVDKVAGLTADTSFTNVIDASAKVFAIGSVSDAVGSPFNGIIDDVQIWNRALTTNEIDELYNLGPY